VAKRIGVSDELIRKALWLIEHAPQDELYKLRSGEKSISRLYRELKNKSERNEVENGIPRFLARLIARGNKRSNIILKINRYTNSEFADIMVGRQLIENYENGCLRAKELGQPVELELIIRETLEDGWRRFERAIRERERALD